MQGSNERRPTAFYRLPAGFGGGLSVPPYGGPGGPVSRRETAVLAYIYTTLVTLVALGVPAEIAAPVALSTGAAAARLLGLI